jgi:hypothetical protein
MMINKHAMGIRLTAAALAAASSAFASHKESK